MSEVTKEQLAKNRMVGKIANMLEKHKQLAVFPYVVVESRKSKTAARLTGDEGLRINFNQEGNLECEGIMLWDEEGLFI